MDRRKDEISAGISMQSYESTQYLAMMSSTTHHVIDNFTNPSKA